MARWRGCSAEWSPGSLLLLLLLHCCRSRTCDREQRSTFRRQQHAERLQGQLDEIRCLPVLRQTSHTQIADRVFVCCFRFFFCFFFSPAHAAIFYLILPGLPCLCVHMPPALRHSSCLPRLCLQCSQLPVLVYISPMFPVAAVHISDMLPGSGSMCWPAACGRHMIIWYILGFGTAV